ncbi:MAG: hypothetical protein ACAH80_15215 [Alphaproteobacteria bacterium]
MADDNPSPPSKGIVKKIAYVLAGLAVAYLGGLAISNPSGINGALILLAVISIGAVILCGATLLLSHMARQSNNALDQSISNPEAMPPPSTIANAAPKLFSAILAFVILPISLMGIAYGGITTFIFPPVGILIFGISIFACQASVKILIKFLQLFQFKSTKNPFEK